MGAQRTSGSRGGTVTVASQPVLNMTDAAGSRLRAKGSRGPSVIALLPRLRESGQLRLFETAATPARSPGTPADGCAGRRVFYRAPAAACKPLELWAAAAGESRSFVNLMGLLRAQTFPRAALAAGRKGSPVTARAPLERSCVERLAKPARALRAHRRRRLWSPARRTGVQYHVDPPNLARIPAAGPLAILANHPFGMLEAAVASQDLGASADVKFMPTRCWRDPRDSRPVHPGQPVRRTAATLENRTPLRRSVEWLRAVGALVCSRPARWRA